MSATLLDGKKLAEQLRTEVARDVALFKEQYGLVPGLAVVLVGEDPASQVYVRNKHKQTIEVGLQSFEHKLPVTTTQDALLELIAELNAAPHVHGILVQLPLPKQIDEHAVIQSIAPAKDVDGFHVVNAGKLATGQPSLVPCTPSGCMKLLALAHKDFSGLHAVVIGRSNIVGKPIAQLLLQANATVTIAHSRTKDMPAMLAQADIVIAALGKPEFVQGAWLKPGCTVIDVGINRITQTDGTHKLVGDVHFENAAERVAFITPVPGGVGPMTIACLLANTLQAAYAIHRI